MLRRLSAVFASVGALALAPVLAQEEPTDPLPKRLQTDSFGADLATGQLQLSATDVVIGQPGAGGLSYTRQYSGLLWREGTLGTITEITTGAGGAAVSFGATSDEFEPAAGQGNYTSSEASGATLDFDIGTGIYTYTAADGTVAIFTQNVALQFTGANYLGVLTQIAKPSGEVITYHYKTQTYAGNPYSRLQSVTNSYGYQLKVEYAFNGTITTIAQLNDWRRRTKVTGINNAVDWCDPMADTCSGFTVTWPTATYTGFFTKDATVTDALGRTTTYDYGTGVRIVGVKWPGSASNNVSFTYDANFRVASVNRGFGTWTYAYSDNAGVRTTTVTAPGGAQRVVTSNLSTGLVTSSKDELNRTTTFEYFANGKLQRVTYPEGNKVEYVYDTRGNLTTTTAIAKAGSGLPNIVTSAVYPLDTDAECSGANRSRCNKPKSTTDARGYRTDYTYDATHGGVLTVTPPAPSGGTPVGSGTRPQTRFAYAQKQARYKNGPSTFVNGPQMWMLASTSACATLASCAGGADETKTDIVYPGTGSPNNLLPTSVTTKAGNNAVSATSAFTYDSIGNLLTVDGPLSGTADTTKFRYDAARQQIGVTGPDPDGGGALKFRAVKTTYSLYGQPTFVERGTVNSQSDADWALFARLERSETVYDTHGRPVQAKLYDGSTSNVLSLVQYSYDSRGRLECTALRMNSATYSSLPSDACTHATAGGFGRDRIARTTYDAASQVLKTTTAYGTALVQDSAVATYSSNGRLLTLTDAGGNRTTYDYDGHDRLKKTRYPSPTTPGVSSTTDFEENVAFDPNGNVTQFRRRDGSLFNNAYDNLNRLTLRDAPGTALDYTYTYDLFSRLTGASQSGHALDFAYDQLSRNTSAAGPLGTVSYQYDAAGNRTRVTWPGSPSLYVQYDYDVTGAMTKARENGASSGLGVLATYAYDNLGRRTSLTRGNGVVTTYSFDGVSRLQELIQNPAGTAQDQEWDYTYNPASQIASQTRTNSAYDFSLAADFADSYTDDGLNRYLTAAGATVTHDARGNTTGIGAKTFAYDVDNRLTSGSGGGLTASTLTYDPAGRLYQIAASATTRFLYDGAQAIAEYTGSNALLRRYVPGASVDETIVWYEGSANLNDKRWLLTDPRGSVVALTDDDGDADLDDGGPLGPAINKYDEYGNPASGFVGRFGFTGQMWIPELQLWHYKARAYSPATGRFMQTDPILYAGGLNLYAYVGNDPANRTDPLGLTDICYYVPDEDGNLIPICVPEPKDEVVTTCDKECQRLANLRIDPSVSQLFRDFAFASPFGGGGERGGREAEDERECNQTLLAAGNLVRDLAYNAAQVSAASAATGLAALAGGLPYAAATRGASLAPAGVALRVSGYAAGVATFLDLTGGLAQGLATGNFSNLGKSAQLTAAGAIAVGGPMAVFGRITGPVAAPAVAGAAVDALGLLAEPPKPVACPDQGAV